MTGINAGCPLFRRRCSAAATASRYHAGCMVAVDGPGRQHARISLERTGGSSALGCQSRTEMGSRQVEIVGISGCPLFSRPIFILYLQPARRWWRRRCRTWLRQHQVEVSSMREVCYHMGMVIVTIPSLSTCRTGHACQQQDTGPAGSLGQEMGVGAHGSIANPVSGPRCRPPEAGRA